MILSSHNGFTLLEMCIVMIISGLMIVGALDGYKLYAIDHRIRVTYERLDKFNAAMNAFYTSQGRFPCPASPGYSMDSAKSGWENCMPNTISDGHGWFKANGRATPYKGSGPDPVYIGSIPYKTLKLGLADTNPNDGTVQDDQTNSGLLPFAGISREDTLDGWGRQMVYAVTDALTLKGSYNPNLGAIAVVTETGNSLVDPPGTAAWVAYSTGDNGIGAYDDDGTVPATRVCNTASPKKDLGNCGALSYSSGAGNMALYYPAPLPPVAVTFISGLRSMVPGFNYFDDILIFSSGGFNGYWGPALDDPVSTGSPNASGSSSARDIVNLNSGSVGIGTNFPSRTLDVNGDIKGQQVHAKFLCDSKASNSSDPSCFEANLLSGGILNCQAGLLNEIQGKSPTCDYFSVPVPSIAPATNCTGGKYAVGINTATGALICQ